MSKRIEGRNVNVLICSEDVLKNAPAGVYIYENGVLLELITAKIEHRKGADGGLYPIVILRTTLNKD